MVREYGNSIKDMTGAAGSRATTKGNPLGLSTGAAGGAASMASRPGFTGGAVKKCKQSFGFVKVWKGQKATVRYDLI
jgi:hypothetical protein